jgi:hypothetical protein
LARQECDAWQCSISVLLLFTRRRLPGHAERNQFKEIAAKRERILIAALRPNSARARRFDMADCIALQCNHAKGFFGKILGVSSCL